MSSSSSYSWMPGWLRKFLNLDEEMPGYGPSSYSEELAASPAPRYAPQLPTAASYTPPALPPSAYRQAEPPAEGGAPRFTPSFLSDQNPQDAVRRFSSFSSAPASAASPVDESGQRTAGPPPLAPRVTANGPSSSSPISDAAANGFVQPLGYGIRAFTRGALPPQGLEQFSRELRATMTDVWNFYSYWIRFETEDVLNMGREAVDAVTGLVPPVGESVAVNSHPRRIKIAQGNGEGEAARRPAPPAPTAVFSPTVTADDAAVPPAGKDTSTEFAARMATETTPVAKSITEVSRKVTEATSADAAAPATPGASTPPAAAPATPSASTPPAATPGTPSASDPSKGKDKGKK